MKSPRASRIRQIVKVVNNLDLYPFPICKFVRATKQILLIEAFVRFELKTNTLATPMGSQCRFHLVDSVASTKQPCPVMFIPSVIVKTLHLLYISDITCSCLYYLVHCFSSSFNPIKDVSTFVSNQKHILSQ